MNLKKQLHQLVMNNCLPIYFIRVKQNKVYENEWQINITNNNWILAMMACTNTLNQEPNEGFFFSYHYNVYFLKSTLDNRVNKNITEKIYFDLFKIGNHYLPIIPTQCSPFSILPDLNSAFWVTGQPYISKIFA